MIRNKTPFKNNMYKIRVNLNSEGDSTTSGSSRSSKLSSRAKLKSCSACRKFAQFTPTAWSKTAKKKRPKKRKRSEKKKKEVADDAFVAEELCKLKVVGEGKGLKKKVSKLCSRHSNLF